MASALVLYCSLRSVPFNLFVASNVGSPFVSSFWSHVIEQSLCWKKQKEEGSMIAFLLKRNNWTKIVLQQADFYCGERKKNGVSPIDIKRFKGRMFSNPLLVVEGFNNIVKRVHIAFERTLRNFWSFPQVVNLIFFPSKSKIVEWIILSNFRSLKTTSFQ